jgi:Flp pilus assembly protein TadB
MIDFISNLPPSSKLAIVFFIFLAIFVASIVARLISQTSRERLLTVLRERRMEASQKSRSAIISAERQMKKTGLRSKKFAFPAVNPKAISRDMRKAGIPGSPIFIYIGAGFLSFMFARFVVNAPIFPVYAQTAFVYPMMFMITRFSIVNTFIDSRNGKSLAQLILFIESVQRAVSVGASADDAVSEAIKDCEKPLRDSLDIVKDLLDLGYEFTEAINLAAERIDLPEFDIFAASLTAQSTTGGSVANVLGDVVEIARSRIDLKKKVATMTAEGVFNAILLGSLPIGLMTYLRLTQPDYFEQMWKAEFYGSIIFFGTFFLAIGGAFLALKIAKIKV